MWNALAARFPTLFAGFAGGIVGAWVDGKSGVAAWGGYCVCGGLTGIYLGEWASHLIPYTDNVSAGFIAGTSVGLLLRLLRGVITRGAKMVGDNGGK